MGQNGYLKAVKIKKLHHYCDRLLLNRCPLNLQLETYSERSNIF